MGSSNSPDTKIGYYSLSAIESNCTLASNAVLVKRRAEKQLTQDLDESNNALAKMRADNKSPEEIEAAANQLRAELNIKLHKLGDLIKASNEGWHERIASAIEAVRVAHGLDLIVDRDALTFRTAQLQGEDVTNLVIGELQSEHEPSSAGGSFTSAGLKTHPYICKGEAVFCASTVGSELLEALARCGIVLNNRTDIHTLDLVRGDMLLIPEQDLQVHTGDASMVLPKGSITCIMARADCITVFDLHDTLRSGRVKVFTPGKSFTLSPGTELVLTKAANVGFSQLNPNASIPYDHLKVSKIEGDATAFACNFSLSSALMAIPMVRTLSTSTDPSERKALSNLVKDAAILADGGSSD